MNLSECRFTHAGQDVRFTVFSDKAIATKLDSVVKMELIGQAEVYRIDPDANAHWVSVLLRTGHKEQWRAWIRRNGEFVEAVDAVMLARIQERVDALRVKPTRRGLAA